MSVVGIALSIGTASLAHHLSNVYNLHHFGRTVVVEGANTGAFAILWVVKFLVFNRLFHSRTTSWRRPRPSCSWRRWWRSRAPSPEPASVERRGVGRA